MEICGHRCLERLGPINKQKATFFHATWLWTFCIIRHALSQSNIIISLMWKARKTEWRKMSVSLRESYSPHQGLLALCTPVSGCLGFQEPVDSRDKTGAGFPWAFASSCVILKNFTWVLQWWYARAPPMVTCMASLGLLDPEWWGLWLPLIYCSLLSRCASSMFFSVFLSPVLGHLCVQRSWFEALSPRYAHGSSFTQEAFLTIPAQIAPLKSLAPYYALCFFIAFVSTCRNVF